MTGSRGQRGVALPSAAQVPPGPHRELLVALHDAYAAAGRPGLRRIAGSITRDDALPATLNHQTVAKILNGTSLPSPRQLTALASWLAAEGNAVGSFGVQRSSTLNSCYRCFVRQRRIALAAITKRVQRSR